MKILFIGDIYGKVGRIAVQKELPKLIKEHKIDFVIANGENVSHGKSLEEHHYDDLKEAGVDVFTMGNHTFFGAKLEKYLSKTEDILVPHNFSPYNEYTGTRVYDIKGKKIRVSCILGRSFMQPIPENPFACLDEIIAEDKSEIHFVDYHAEATAEKIAVATNYDGKISALVGTHTHVQTADERILSKGTAFLTDAGMTGPRDSIIGADPVAVISRAKTSMPARFRPAEGRYQFMGCIIDFDDKTNQALSIERISIVQND